MKRTLLLIACLALPVMAHAAQVPPIPLGLKCSLATVIHSDEFPETSTKSDNLIYMNQCVSAVQAYAHAHCPQSKNTIWQQIEAVAFSGPGISDARALTAACAP